MNDSLYSLRYELLTALEQVMVDGQVLQSTLLDTRAGASAYEDACRFYSAVDSARRLALLVCTATAGGSQARTQPRRASAGLLPRPSS